jgi:uncharacterized lipoprotein YmbA
VNASRRACLRAAPGFLAAALAACTSPPAHYFRLAVVQGLVQGDAILTVGIRSVSIPAALDQNGIAKAAGAYHFEVYSNELWAEPLADMLQAAMVQDLAQRLPAATVIGSGGSIGAPTDVQIEINVLRFDPDSTGRVILNAQIAIRSDRDRWLTRHFASSAAPAGPDAANIVATMSTLWGALADQVASIVVQSQAWPHRAVHY